MGRGVAREKNVPSAVREDVAPVPDPRMARPRWHKLRANLGIALWAVLCGAESSPAREDCGQEREVGLRHFLEWPEGLPSQDPFTRVWQLLDPEAWQAWLLRWRPAVAAGTAGEVVAIEGKVLRRAFATGTGKPALPLVSAGASAYGG